MISFRISFVRPLFNYLDSINEKDAAENEQDDKNSFELTEFN